MQTFQAPAPHAQRPQGTHMLMQTLQAPVPGASRAQPPSLLTPSPGY
jgi:hypothetical protein